MKIAVLSSHTESLFWFRLDMMKDFIEKGHTVLAVGSEPETEWQEKFAEHGIKYTQISVQRNSLNLIKDFKTFSDLNRFIKRESPDKIFAYQAKTIVYGSIAAKLNKVTGLYILVAGLGTVFRGQGLKNLILRTIMSIEYKMAFKFSKMVFFQNNDDRQELVSKKLIKESKTFVINGSGVNLKKFKKTPLPDNPTFLFIGRLIKDKGVIEYLEACKIIKDKYPNVKCLLVGPYDSNPSALKEEELQPYIDSGVIEYCGEQADVRPFISRCSVYVLPSYHEGTPKTILEAMAMGRPIITTDAPGCRETVVDGQNGFLVPVKDVEALVEKMEFFVLNPEVTEDMGTKSFEFARSKYDVNLVNQQISCVIK